MNGKVGWFWEDTWTFMYLVDPAQLPLSDDDSAHATSPAAPSPITALAGQVLGGEANMWSEQVSDLNINSRIFPRASAVAERLWSPSNVVDVGMAAQRLAQHRCRMATLGFQVGPIWADFCAADSARNRLSPLPSFLPYANEKTSDGNDSLLKSAGAMAMAAPTSRPKPVLKGDGQVSMHSALIVVIALASAAVGFICAQVLHWSRARQQILSSPSNSSETTPLLADTAALLVSNYDSSSLSHSPGSPLASSCPPLQSINSSQVTGTNRGSLSFISAPSHTNGNGAEGGHHNTSSITASERRRIKSLDVFRGFTVILMIFVDELGSSFPIIHHCPWDGIRLADFVVPFFDFLVGVSIALSFRNKVVGSGSGTWSALKKALIRFLKLFFIGMLTQGGLSIANYNLKYIRIMGILQRVAVCYLFGALVELFCPRHDGWHQVQGWSSSTLRRALRGIIDVFSRYRWHWLCALITCAAHTAIMYGVHVPPAFGLDCGRGVLTPPCNAASYVDKLILSENHMYFPANGGRLTQLSTCITVNSVIIHLVNVNLISLYIFKKRGRGAV